MVDVPGGISRWWQRLSPLQQGAVVALIAMTVGSLLYAAGLYPLDGRAAETALPIRFAVLALASAVLLFRRAAPVFALSAGLVPLGIDLALGASVPIYLAYADLVFAAVLYSSARVARRVIACSLTVSLAVCIAVGIVSADPRDVALAAWGLFGGLGLPIWWALSVRTHRDVAEAERARAHALTVVAELDRRAAVAEERNRMARDLHDVVAGHLSAIAILSEAATRSPDSVPEILESVRANSIGALEEMRAMIGLLRSESDDAPAAPRRLAHLPLLVASAAAAGTAVEVTGADTLHDIPTAVDQAAYRIAQEALTNAMKHAPRQPVTVQLHRTPTLLTLHICNQIVKPVVTVHESGIANMRERTTLLGGRCTAGPDGRTWRVRAELPLQVPA